MTTFLCPVCGYPELEEQPRNASRGGSYEICPSCGFEFGYTDDDQGHTYASWRRRWVADGMKWRDIDEPPRADWDAQKQLNNLQRPDHGGPSVSC